MRHLRRLAVSDLAVAAIVLGWFTQPHSPMQAAGDPFFWLAAGFAPVSLYLRSVLADHPLAGACRAVGALSLWSVAAAAWAGPLPPAAWAASWLTLASAVAVALALALYPHPPRSTPLRVVDATLLGLGVLGVSSAAFAALPQVAATQAGVGTATVARILVVLSVAGAALTMLTRCHHVSSGRRPQRFLLPPLALILIGGTLDALGDPIAIAPGLVALPLALAYGVSLSELEDEAPVAGLTNLLAAICTFGAYLLLLLISGLLIGHGLAHSSMALVAVAATTLSPVLRGPNARLQRWLSGPSRTLLLADMDERLEAAGEAGTALQETVEAVAEQLQASYVELRLTGAESSHLAARVGSRPSAGSRVIRLQVAGRPVGSLRVAPSLGEDFNPHEIGLLREIGRQAAVVAQSLAMADALSRAGDQLTSAREEERERLRADLHDGLGPVLAGVKVRLAAARARTPAHDPVADLLITAQDDLTQAGSAVRELIDDLRPSRLEAGLVEAVEELAVDVLPRNHVHVVELGERRSLDEAVEVAIYRILCEAVANIAKHAEATRCRIDLTWWRNAVHVRVLDNGRGSRTAWRPGVGLSSMSSRARRHGGRLWVRRTHSGTSVHVIVPVEAAADVRDARPCDFCPVVTGGQDPPAALTAAT